MLPDTLHTLPQNERFAYAKLLAFIAKIDNDVTVDEMAMFEQRMGTALLSPNQRAAIRDYLQNPPTLSECLEDLKISSDGKAGKLALRDAIMMSAADGTVDEEELDIDIYEVGFRIGARGGVNMRKLTLLQIAR